MNYNFVLEIFNQGIFIIQKLLNCAKLPKKKKKSSLYRTKGRKRGERDVKINKFISDINNLITAVVYMKQVVYYICNKITFGNFLTETYTNLQTIFFPKDKT